MANEIENLYKDINFCRNELLEVRDLIGSTKATEHTFDCAFRSLALMRIYAPAEFLPMVDAQLNETVRRQSYFFLRRA